MVPNGISLCDKIKTFLINAFSPGKSGQNNAFFAMNPAVKLRLFPRLLGLVLIAIVPMVLFATGLVVYLAEQRAQALENNVQGTTRALVSAVDENIAGIISGLRILSESEGFEADTIQYLHKRLRQFVKNQQDWDHISFVDTKGMQIFNTSRPYGRKLPRLGNENFFREMMNSGRPVITGHRKGEKAITVAVPVKKNGHIIYALIGSLKLSSFERLLRTQELPGNWTAAILDGDMTYLAHSRKSDYFTGRRASAQIAEKASGKGEQGFALANSRITNWKIFLRIPDDGHLFTSWKTIIFIVLGGSLLLALSILVALLIARNISRPLLSLTKSARALGEGKPIRDINTGLSEITEVNEALKSAAATRDENEKRIQEAVNVRDTFLSVASHELKSPLTSLKLQFQMLSRNQNKELEKPLKRIGAQVERLNKLIDELLDVTRISAGKMTFSPEVFDLVTLTEDVIQGTENSHLITLDAPASLMGKWDRHRIEQVMVNLTSNAIKYGNGMPVAISILPEDEVVTIEVRDRGFGISPQDLEKIFERYERVGNHTGISGLGLGLWIVKKILEGCGGGISVRSQPGEGTTFTVTLPLTETATCGTVAYAGNDRTHGEASHLLL